MNASDARTPTAREVLDVLHDELLPLLASALQDLDEAVAEDELVAIAREKVRTGFRLAQAQLSAMHAEASTQSAADALRTAAALVLEPSGVRVVVHAPEYVRVPFQRELVLIVGELCSNVAESGALSCDVHLHLHEQYVSLVVHDDGGGTSEPARDAAMERSRDRMASVCRRVAEINGRAMWQRPVTGGTRAKVTVAL